MWWWWQISYPLDVFIGPVCPYVLAPVARFSGKWKIPVLSTGGHASAFRVKVDYPLLTTVGGNYEMFGEFFNLLLKKYHWEKFALLYRVIKSKGTTPCDFNVQAIWKAFKQGKANYTRPHSEPLFEDELNATKIEELLTRMKAKARGKSTSSQSSGKSRPCIHFPLRKTNKLMLCIFDRNFCFFLFQWWFCALRPPRFVRFCWLPKASAWWKKAIMCSSMWNCSPASE